MTTTLQVVQAFDTYKVGDQLTVPNAVAQALQKAYPGRFQFISIDSSGSGSGGTTTPATPTPTTGLTLADVDGEIATALTAKGLPAGTTVSAVVNAAIAAQGSGSGVSSAQAAALALVLG